MTNAKRRVAIALAVAFLPCFLTVFAEDLTVASGETVALNSSTNYVNITVEGTLNVARVGSDAAPKVSVSNIAVNGGAIAVSGTRSALGYTDDQWTVRPLCTLSAANGAYGKLSISGNSSNTTLAQMQEYGLCAASLVIAESQFRDALGLLPHSLRHVSIDREVLYIRGRKHFIGIDYLLDVRSGCALHWRKHLVWLQQRHIRAFRGQHSVRRNCSECRCEKGGERKTTTR